MAVDLLGKAVGLLEPIVLVLDVSNSDVIGSMFRPHAQWCWSNDGAVFPIDSISF